MFALLANTAKVLMKRNRVHPVMTRRIDGNRKRWTIGRLIKGRSFYKEPWYNSYRCMMSRCYRKKDPSYKYYGGRGIKVCNEWHDILLFEAWVKQHPFFDGATIDRIDSNDDYAPNNCRWATMFEQDKNRRNSVLIEWNGETHNITEWANITGINRSTLNNRYWRGERGERLFRKVVQNVSLDRC